LRGLLSGTLDMDKLDYLPRDARACNVPYGGVDTARLIGSLSIISLDGTGERRIGIRGKGISPLHSLINARQEMFDNVYWHHTNRACMVMLLRAVQEALVHGVILPEDLTGHDDASLLAFMRSDDMPSGTRALADALAQRRIHKRALEISARADILYERLGQLWYDALARRDVEIRLARAISERLGQPVDSTAILIDIPKPEKWKTDVWVSFDQPPVGMQPLMHWQDVVGLGDTDFKRYEEHRRMIRIVTEERYRSAFAADWEALVYPALGGIPTE
jgi:HD superfamily phosphohydrolase